MPNKKRFANDILLFSIDDIYLAYIFSILYYNVIVNLKKKRGKSVKWK